MVSSLLNSQHYLNEAAIRYHTYTSIWVVIPDWHSKDQNQPRATSIALCGSPETVVQRLSCSVLIFLSQIRPWTFVVFVCSSRSRNYQQEHAMGYLSVHSCQFLMQRLLHSRQFWISEKNQINMFIWEKLLKNTHKYLANEFSEGSIAAAS
jgi:hypothetical protein